MNLKKIEKHTVNEWLSLVDFNNDASYVPSKESLQFIHFMKQVNVGFPQSHKTPILHYRVIDGMLDPYPNVANMLFRGSAKTTLCEYLVLYVAVYGGLPIKGLEEINLGIFLGDNAKAVSQFGSNLEDKWSNSAFLRQLIPEVKFNVERWKFVNLEGKKFVMEGFSAKSGFRGKREGNSRPQLAILDDLIKDSDATSPTIIAKINDVVNKALVNAMDITNFKIIWNGTPYNSKDPLYRAIESGAYKVNVFPVCNKFPVAEKDFKGAWGDRFTYEALMFKYNSAKKKGELDSFYGELMLEITNEEQRCVKDNEIVWHKQNDVNKNLHKLIKYITSDFATSVKENNDYSPINVWGYGDIGEGCKWYWLAGTHTKVTVDVSIDTIFNYVQMYSPLEVGIEVSGQQGGFVSWIEMEMKRRNIFFTLARGKTLNMYSLNVTKGIMPLADKFTRFMTNALPLFKTGRISFPEEQRDSEEIKSITEEIKGATFVGFKSRFDDQIDNISMLGEFTIWDSEMTRAGIVPTPIVDNSSNPFSETHLSNFQELDYNENNLTII